MKVVYPKQNVESEVVPSNNSLNGLATRTWSDGNLVERTVGGGVLMGSVGGAFVEISILVIRVMAMDGFSDCKLLFSASTSL